MRHSLNRWFAVGCLLFLAVPGLSMAAYRVLKGSWEMRSNLAGAWAPVIVAPPSLESLARGEFQRSFANWFNQHFGLRAHFVRMYNQYLYTAYRKTRMLSGSLLIGKGDWLYEAHYANDYVRVNPLLPPPFFEEWASRLRAASDALKRRNQAFVVLLSPSKAAIYPEFLPPDLLKLGAKELRNYDWFTNALSKAGVPCVDGHLIAAREKARGAFPVFARGGGHWNGLAAFLTLSNLLDRAQMELGHPIAMPSLAEVKMDLNPVSNDRDLARALNLVLGPMRYAGVHVETALPPAGREQRPKLAIVGNSFNWILLPLAFDGEARVFERVSFGYYNHDFYDYTPASPWNRMPVSEWKASLAESDIVVLEVNEASIDRDQYWRNFVADLEAMVGGQ